MQEAIVKTEFGFHIDLDRIITISKITSRYTSSSGSYSNSGYVMSFKIDVQLRDSPIIVDRVFRGTECRIINHDLFAATGLPFPHDWVEMSKSSENDWLAFREFSRHRENLIELWVARKRHVGP